MLSFSVSFVYKLKHMPVLTKEAGQNWPLAVLATELKGQCTALQTAAEPATTEAKVCSAI